MRTRGNHRQDHHPTKPEPEPLLGTPPGYSAHVPDLPGCIAAGETMEFHIEGMRLNGETVPEPTAHVEQVEIPA